MRERGLKIISFAVMVAILFLTACTAKTEASEESVLKILKSGNDEIAGGAAAEQTDEEAAIKISTEESESFETGFSDEKPSKGSQINEEKEDEEKVAAETAKEKDASNEGDTKNSTTSESAATTMTPTDAFATAEKPDNHNEARELTMEMVQMNGYNEVTFDALPDTAEEFAALAEGALSTPEYTGALFLCAIKLFAENKDAGVEALRILKGPVEVSNYDINWYNDRLRDKKYLYKVYFEGSTPENSYTPNDPLTVRFYPNPRPQDLEEGFIKLGFQAPAFDSPRYFTLRQKGDEWFIWEISSVMLGVRTPANEDPWK